MKIKLVIIFIFTIAICACTRESNRHEKFGRFIVTTHLVVDKLKWEGGNSHLDYTEVCRDDGQLCFRGDDDLRYFYSKKHSRLAVSNTQEIRLFDTKAGNLIKCDLSRLNGRLKHAFSAYWSDTSFILYTWRETNDIYDERTEVLTFNESGCSAIKSFDSTSEKRQFHSQNTENGEIAWAVCNKTKCTLKWLESDFITSHQKEIGCSENNNLEIVWTNGMPEPRNRDGPKKLYCLNEAGELKYPFPPDVPFVADNTADATY